MSTNIADYKKLYIESASKLILQTQHDLKSMMTDPGSLERLHRNAHSLKGESLAMGYVQTGNLSKLIEHYVKEIIDQKVQCSSETSAKVNKALESISESLRSIDTTNQEVDLKNDIQIMEELLAESTKP